MSKKVVAYTGLMIATLVGHGIFNMHRETIYLRTLLEMTDQKDKIQADQIRELISDLQLANQKSELLKAEGYISGVIDMVDDASKKEYFQQIWHNGYDRGSSVRGDMENLAKTGHLEVKQASTK